MTGVINRTYKEPVVSGIGGIPVDQGIMTYQFLGKTDTSLFQVAMANDGGALNLDGTPLVHRSYATLEAMKVAIDNGFVASGEWAYIPCAADTYHNPGFILAKSVQGHPSWRGTAPWSAVGSTPTVLASAGTGVLTADGSGRPVLNVGAVNGDYIEVLLGRKGGPAKIVRSAALFQYGAATVDGQAVGSLFIRRDSDLTTKYIHTFNLFFSSGWESGHIFKSTGVYGTALLNTTPLDASKYVAATPILYDVTFETTGAQPVGTYKYVAANGSGTTSASVPAGEGDFTVATQLWQMSAGIHSTGAAGTLTITGLAYQTRV